ncbi:MAG: PA14 domain-containing protein, partial [Planctomycetota bacterium]
VLVVAFAFCTTAVASDIAFYVGSVNPGWYEVPNMLADVDTIIAETGSMFKDVSQFDDDQFDEFGAWVDERMDDGKMDIIWLNGCMPSVLYQFPNVNPDGSRAEEWLDGGNMFINVGDWFGYMSYEGGTRSADNGGSGAANILDLSSGIIVSADNTSLPVTEAGQEYLPSLNDPAITYRPIALGAVQAPWEVAAVFAGNATQADPVVLYNTETEGYIAFINQAAGGPSSWIDDRGLTCAEFIANWVNEVIGLGGGGNPLARRPEPEDGALFFETWGTLTWKPGYYAVSHDVYMGTNFDDVNNGAADTFVGNVIQPMQIVGFPGFPFPDGLVPGQTYYWRIDEVNDANTASPWKGDVWSFSLPPKTGYNPIPADGAKFIETEAPTLSWTAGHEAKLHHVYFGTSFEEVDNAIGALPQAITTYTPSIALEPETTYYWRVDEFDVLATHKGPVWSFTTAGEGGGVKGQYFQGMTPAGIPALTRIDPQIDFSWGDPGGPDASVGDDNFSARWTGEVEAVFTETHTFYTSSDDGVRLWIDGQQLINNWTDHGTTENSGKIDLVAGNTYSLVMEYYENGGGAVARLLWSSPSTPKQPIPQAALSQLVHAYNAGPPNGTEGVNLMSKLSWSPGDFAASHEVYLGTDADSVANATKASPEYKGSKALGEETLDPGQLAFDTTYYWRIDEVNATNPDSPWVGNVWSFWTGDFLVVDDFESYNDIDPLPGETGNRIFDKWIDGYGTTTNGALVGNDLPPYAEQTIVNGGDQSMIYRYDNANKTSEATLTLVYPRDWTAEGVTKLSIMFRGSSGNSADRMFVALGNAVVYHPDASATQITGWNEWVIDLTEFAGVDLTNVGSITIGIGTRNAPAAGDVGTMYFDDIRLVK